MLPMLRAKTVKTWPSVERRGGNERVSESQQTLWSKEGEEKGGALHMGSSAPTAKRFSPRVLRRERGDHCSSSKGRSESTACR